MNVRGIYDLFIDRMEDVAFEKIYDSTLAYAASEGFAAYYSADHDKYNCAKLIKLNKVRMRHDWYIPDFREDPSDFLDLKLYTEFMIFMSIHTKDTYSDQTEKDIRAVRNKARRSRADLAISYLESRVNKKLDVKCTALQKALEDDTYAMFLDLILLCRKKWFVYVEANTRIVQRNMRKFEKSAAISAPKSLRRRLYYDAFLATHAVLSEIVLFKTILKQYDERRDPMYFLDHRIETVNAYVMSIGTSSYWARVSTQLLYYMNSNSYMEEYTPVSLSEKDAKAYKKEVSAYRKEAKANEMKTKEETCRNKEAALHKKREAVHNVKNWRNAPEGTDERAAYTAAMAEHQVAWWEYVNARLEYTRTKAEEDEEDEDEEDEEDEDDESPAYQEKSSSFVEEEKEDASPYVEE